MYTYNPIENFENSDVYGMHYEEATDFTVIYRPALLSERALQNYKPGTFSRKFRGEGKLWSIVRDWARYQDILTD
jgi:hypothetical protein